MWINFKYSLFIAGIFADLWSSLGAAPTRVKKKWKFETLSAIQMTVTQSKVIEESTNPENSIYQLPVTKISTELRPEFKVKYGRNSRLVIRPRFVYDQSHREAASLEHKRDEGQGRAYINEAYGVMAFGQKWQSTVGLQNFQWGPAEIASPSNPLFRDLGLDKPYAFETRGKSLLRVNYSPEPGLSLIAIGEVADNSEEKPKFEASFRRKALLKTELADASQTDYVGLVLVGTQLERPEVGVYAHWEVLAGLTSYFDGTLRYGSTAYYPVLDELDAGFRQNRLQSHAPLSTAVIGLRYVTEGNWDFRLEGVRDEGGWTPEDRKTARILLAADLNAKNLALFLQPGTILPGQRFVYGSLRVPNLWPQNSVTATVRSIYSLADRTYRDLLTFDSYIGDHFVVSLGGSSNAGPLNGELTQGYRWSSFLYGSWIW